MVDAVPESAKSNSTTVPTTVKSVIEVVDRKLACLGDAFDGASFIGKGDLEVLARE
jgi:hypothetical protein